MIDVIRSLEQQDLLHIESLFSQANQYVVGRNLSDYWLYATLFSETCLVAVKDGKIVGAVLAFINQSNQTDVYLQDLVVATSSRKQGVGLTLMQNLIARSAAHNIKRIWLTSEIENKPAMALWAKLGFSNPKADYEKNGYWVTKDLKGPNKDRVIFEYHI